MKKHYVGETLWLGELVTITAIIPLCDGGVSYVLDGHTGLRDTELCKLEKDIGESLVALSKRTVIIPVPELPKYYTGLVVCTKAHTVCFKSMFSLGRVIEIADGEIVSELIGDTRRVEFVREHFSKIKSFDDLNSRFFGDVKFVEVET